MLILGKRFRTYIDALLTNTEVIRMHCFVNILRISVALIAMAVGAGAADNFIIKDEAEFSKVIASDAQITKLATGMKFTEGPVWIPQDGCVIFSDIPSDELKKWKSGKLTTFRKPSRNVNGNALDREERLVSCGHGSRAVMRTGKDGKIETLVEKYNGRKLNSPNDVVVKSDDTIWFTDPHYGLRGRKREIDSNNVYRFDPASGDLKVLVSDFHMPNGLCFSPREDKLYIADSGKPHHVRVFDVKPDGSLANDKVFCVIDNGGPDGMRCDRDGRLWSSAGDGIHIFATSGNLIGKILVPEKPSNLCFGGKDGKTLFITARKSLYSIQLKVTAAVNVEALP